MGDRRSLALRMTFLMEETAGRFQRNDSKMYRHVIGDSIIAEHRVSAFGLMYSVSVRDFFPHSYWGNVRRVVVVQLKPRCIVIAACFARTGRTNRLLFVIVGRG